VVGNAVHHEGTKDTKGRKKRTMGTRGTQGSVESDAGCNLQVSSVCFFVISVLAT